LPRPQITFNLTETDLQQVDVFYGTEVELEWQTQHATSTQLIIRSGLEPEGTAPETRPIESSGTQKLSVEQPMVVTLKASDYYLLEIPLLSSTVEKTVTINLRPPQVTCLSQDGECLIRDHHNPNQPMKATTQPLCYGSETQLSWKVQGAKTVSPMFQGSQPTHTEQSSVTLPIDTPTTFLLTATNGIDTVVTELVLPLAAPVIDCLKVNGQCLDSAQFNDLCFGDTLDIQVKGSCYQSVTSQAQTDEQLETFEETQFSFTPDKPTQLSVIATNGVNQSQKALAINFKPPVIDCLAVNGQCLDSAQLNDLCFGDTLNIQIKGSCYQSVHSELKTDEQLKTIEKTQFSLTPDKPTQLRVIATNGVNQSQKALAINFKPPVIHTFCGPGSTVAFGSVQPLNWETRCSAKVVLKPVTETPEAPITSTYAEGKISPQIKSTRYELTAYNHLGKNAQQAQQVIELKVATSGLLPVKLPNKPAASFFIQRHEVTQKDYQHCDSCEQWADQSVSNNLYCIHGIDWKQKLLLGGQGNSPKAIVCLNAEQAEELLETEEFEPFNYQPSPDDLEIYDQALPKECWISLANTILFGWPGGRLQQDNLPAVCVSWQDAATYANWKSQQQGLTGCYDNAFTLQPDCDGYRLPTNEQWQLAALGTEYKTKAQWFPWGKARLDCKRLGLQPDCALPLPREVETNRRDLSPFWIKDMGLSVSEWVNDRDGEVVIARGLNYTTYWPTFTDDHRFDQYKDQDENYFTEDRVSNIGFRLVQPLTESLEESRLCVPTDNHK
jgi:formylglycine-generating enzyme required for sulfatase activity